MQLEALFFDLDGTIIDTERDGHRVAFNRTFREFGIDVEWDVDTYRSLLAIAGGKERIRHYYESQDWAGFPHGDHDATIAEMHRRKTDIFIDLLEAGALPLRPGVRRLMGEANAAGVKLLICTTSNERAARTVVRSLLQGVEITDVLAGDVVPRKKPDPAIYGLALEHSRAAPDRVVVIEDSQIGIQAAKALDLAVVATSNPYTSSEDLSPADLVLTGLGDPEGPKAELVSSSHQLQFDGVLALSDIAAYFE